MKLRLKNKPKKRKEKQRLYFGKGMKKRKQWGKEKKIGEEAFCEQSWNEVDSVVELKGWK